MQQKLAAILAIEVEARPDPVPDAAPALGLATIQCELVDPTISRYGGRIFALTPSSTLVEFVEAATAVACALEIQRGMAERKGPLPELRIGVDRGEVATASGDLEGNAVTVARGLARRAADGRVAVSGRVAKSLGRRRSGVEITRRGELALAGGARLEMVELRPLAGPRLQSPWTVRRRWTWLAAIAAVVLLLGAAVVLWRPVREWLLPAPTAAAVASGARQGAFADLAERALGREGLGIDP